MTKYAEKYWLAEGEIIAISKEARKQIETLGTRASLLEAAIRVLVRHDLVLEFAREVNNPPKTPGTADDHSNSGPSAMRSKSTKDPRP